MKKSLVKICAPVMAVCMLGACSNAPAETTEDGLFGDANETTAVETTAETVVETTEETEETVVETEPEILVIGDEATATVSVNLMNTTDDDIVAIYIKVEGGEYSDNLLADTFASGEDRVFYYNNSNDSEDAKYTVKITFKSGEEDELHKFSFDKFVGADIAFQDGQVFLKYKDIDGDVSTYDDEVAHDTPVATAAPTSSQDRGCIGDEGLFY